MPKQDVKENILGFTGTKVKSKTIILEPEILEQEQTRILDLLKDSADAKTEAARKMFLIDKFYHSKQIENMKI